MSVDIALKTEKRRRPSDEVIATLLEANNEAE